MNKMALILFTICLLAVDLFETRAVGAAGSVLNQPAQPGTLQPKPNPNALNAPLATDPTFDIGYIIPARSGFQPCQISGRPYWISVDLYSNRDGLPQTYYRNWNYQLCAMGNVTLTQTNPRASISGKTLRFWVRRYQSGEQSQVETIDIYENWFPNQNTLTLQVVFASSYEPTSTSENLADYTARLFSQGRPLDFYVQYYPDANFNTNLLFTTRFSSSLACRFVALPKGSRVPTEVDCFNQPPPQPPWVFTATKGTPCLPDGRC